MAQNLYPPMALLKKTAQQYPKAWELMANFHAENGMNGLPTWPDWCYAPMSAAVAIASGGRNFLLLPVNQQQDIINSAQRIFALTTWRLSKEVYQIDSDFAQLLFEQTNDLDIPSEIFYSFLILASTSKFQTCFWSQANSWLLRKLGI